MAGIGLEHIPEDLHGVLQRFVAGGFEVWLVGGALRDILLGLGPKDWDLATSATPAEVMGLFERVVPIGVRHGTVQVHTRLRSLEVTTCPSGGGGGILEDLRRRDFTVNALALAYPGGQLLDPFSGRLDLLAGTLRAVADARARFREDPLRTLRAGRFVSVYGFEVEPQTFAAIAEAAPGLQRVAPERIREEFFKLLLGEHFGNGFEVMVQSRVLPQILPEFTRHGESGLDMAHGRETIEHVVQTVQSCPYRIQVRLAALFHHLRGEERGEVPRGGSCRASETCGSALAAQGILLRWRASQRLMREVVGLLTEQVPEAIEAWSDGDIRRFLARIGPGRLDDVMALAHADRVARPNQPEGPAAIEHLKRRISEELKSNPPLRPEDLAITGKDVMGALDLPPGPLVGRLLQSLFQEVLENPTANDPKFLMDFLKKEYSLRFQLPPLSEGKSRSKEDDNAGRELDEQKSGHH